MVFVATDAPVDGVRPPSLEALYRAHADQVFTLARRICPEDADDVLQETFLEAGRSLKRFRGDGPVDAWLKRICASKALMRLRKRRRVEEVPLDLPFTAPLDARMDLEPALHRLGETARAVVWLYDVEGFSHAEIARMFGKTSSFSKSQLSRAHQALKAWLKPEDGGLP